MQVSHPISIERLRQLIVYAPDTGELVWLPRPREMFGSDKGWLSWNARYANKPALFATQCGGYDGGTILKKGYMAHRVAFALFHGRWPNGEVDHINGDRADNRVENLREVSHARNSRNVAMSCKNTSGVTGVYWHKEISKWVAEIKVNRRKIYLGAFSDIEEAKAARLKAQSEYGFSARHGLPLPINSADAFPERQSERHAPSASP
jgi:hypothetical protein